MGNNQSSLQQSFFFQNYQVVKANQSEDYFYLTHKQVDPFINGKQSNQLILNKQQIYQSQFVGCKLRVMGSQQQNRIQRILNKKMSQQNANPNYSIQKIKQFQKHNHSGYCSTQSNYLIIYQRINTNLASLFVHNKINYKNNFNQHQISYIIERIATALYFLDQIQDPCLNLTLSKILVNRDNNVYLQDPFLYSKEMEDQTYKKPININSNFNAQKEQSETFFSPQQLANIQTFNSSFDSLNSQLFKLGIIGLQMYNLNENYQKKLYLNDGQNNKKIDWKMLNQELQLIKQKKLRQKIKLLTSTKGSYRRKIYEIINRQNQTNPQVQKYNLKELQFFPTQQPNFKYKNTLHTNNYSIVENQQGQSSSKVYSNDMIKLQRERKQSQDINANSSQNIYQYQKQHPININLQNESNKQHNFLINSNKIDSQLYAPIKLNIQRLTQSQQPNNRFPSFSFQKSPNNYIQKNTKSSYYNDSLPTNSTYTSSYPNYFQYPEQDKIIQWYQTDKLKNIKQKQSNDINIIKSSSTNLANLNNLTNHANLNQNYYPATTISTTVSFIKNQPQPFRFREQNQQIYKPDLYKGGNQTNFKAKYNETPKFLNQLCLNKVESKNDSSLNQFQPSQNIKASYSQLDKQKQISSFPTFKKIDGEGTISNVSSKNYQNYHTKTILDGLISKRQERESETVPNHIQQQFSQTLSDLNKKTSRASQNIYSTSKKPDILINDFNLSENKNQVDNSKLFSPSEQNFLINIIQKQSPKSISQRSNRYSDLDIDSPIPYISDKKSQISKMSKSSQKNYFQPGQQLEYVIQQYQNGSRYEGYKKNGFRQGHGKFYYQQGSVYEGEWKNNQMHGYGKLYYSNGELAYEGQWYQDEFNGFGKVYNDKPTMLDGSFDYSNFNNLEQQWIYYDGELKKDAKEGHGKIMLQNGEWFQGQFKEDRINGEGTFWNLYGDNIKGIWEDSILIKKIK